MSLSRFGYFLVVMACSGALYAAPPNDIPPSEIIIEKFDVAAEGEMILLPVVMAGAKHMFVLDTGTKRTLFDSALPLRRPKGIVRAPTGLGDVELSVHNPPIATVGSIPFSVRREVGAMDLAWLREGTGLPIDGILGMDFIGQHIIHIDFDLGRLCFLKRIPPGLDTEGIPLSLTSRPC